MSYELLESGNVKIGEKAPDFNAISTFGNISLKDYEGKWLVMASAIFTPRRFYPSMHNRNDSIY